MAIKQLDSIGQELFMSRYAYPGETKYSERCKAMKSMRRSFTML
jgi:hypothetical protein